MSQLLAEVPSAMRRGVPTFDDQVIKFETEMKGFSSEMDLTTLVDHGEEIAKIMEKVVADIVRDVQEAMDSNGNEDGSRDADIIETWCSSMLALSRMASDIMFNKLEEVTMALTVRVVDKIIEAMLLLIPIMSPTNIRSKCGYACQTRLQIKKLEYLYVYDGVFRFQVVVGQLDEIFDTEPRARSTPSAMTSTVDTSTRLTAANVAKLPRDLNYLDSYPFVDYDLEQTSSGENTSNQPGY